MKPIELRLYQHLDLRKEARSIPLCDVQIADVRLTMRDIAASHRCIVIDRDGAIKVLKDRGTINEYRIVERPTNMSSTDDLSHYLNSISAY